MVAKFWIVVTGEPSVGIPHFEICVDLEIDIDDYNEPVGIEFDDERQVWIEQEAKIWEQQEVI